MAIFYSTGVNLGIRKAPYSIDNEDGTTNSGESWRILIHDTDAMIVNEFAVPEDVRGIFDEVPVGVTLKVRVDVQARSVRGGGAALSMRARDFTS